ncbi:hypothetical protein ACFLW2_01200 [Chloroflexota bacterium]
MSNTKKILKEIASGEEYKDLTDAIEQADYDVIFNSYMSISELIKGGKKKIEEGIENLPIRSRNERLDKFRQSFDLAIERTLPLWHELNQALIKRQIMEGEVFGIGKKGDPLVRTPGGALVALRGSKLEEGNQARFIVDYEGEKISIGRVFTLNPYTFYTLITQESRERIKRSLTSIDELLKTGQELLKEGSFSQVGEILVELEEIKDPPPTFKPEERERIIAQAQRYRNRLLYDIGVRSMYDFLSQQEEKEIEEFYHDRPEEKNKALSALGLFRYHTYETAEELVLNDKPEEYGQALSEIEDEIDSMESAMKLMDHKAAIERAYPKAKSYIEKTKRIFDRLTGKVGQVVDALPEEGMVEPEAIQMAIKNTFDDETLFLELRKAFRSSQEFFSQRGAFSELIRKLGDQESIAAETAFRSYLNQKISQAYTGRR